MKANDSVSNFAVCDTAAGRLLGMNKICNLFARILDYPGPEIFTQVRDLAARLGASHPEAAQSFEEFESALKGMGLGELEELYTTTFDMRPDRTTNLGCHLFGEDVRRNLFMAQLKERLEARQIRLGCELPDHLCLVLQLIAGEVSEEEARTLIDDCLTPAVTRILSTFEENANPYTRALKALLAVLDGGRVVMASQGSSDLAAG